MIEGPTLIDNRFFLNALRKNFIIINWIKMNGILTPSAT